MARVVWSRVARDDLQGIIAYIRSDAPAYARSFALRLTVAGQKPESRRPGTSTDLLGASSTSKTMLESTGLWRRSCRTLSGDNPLSARPLSSWEHTRPSGRLRAR